MKTHWQCRNLAILLGLAGVYSVPAAGPAIGIERLNNSIMVRFEGTLQTADAPEGPFTSIAGATSPYPVESTGRGRQFWRSMALEPAVILTVTGGGRHSTALSANGTLRTWGANLNGQLGLGSFTSVSPFGINSPQIVGLERSWQRIATGADHTIALKADGSMRAWGFNGYGQLGDGTETGTSQPQPIGPGTTWRTVAAGGHHTIAIRADGTLWSWGDNREGQVGNGTIDFLYPFGPNHGIPSPVQLDTNTSWVMAAAGPSHSLALRRDGSLWAWGLNLTGQLGLGLVNQRVLRPQSIAGTGVWRAVRAGLAHTVALRVDGSIWTWGLNSDGQAGLGTNIIVSVPQAIGTNNTWLAVDAGARHTVALRADGALWGCGRNDSGQLAQVGTNRVNTLRPIETNSIWCAIAAGEHHTLALRRDRTLWAWGANASGQLGDGTFSGSREPRLVAGSQDW